MTKLANKSRDSSISFSEDSEEVRVRRFAKHMLKSTLFIGSFLEKRFVEPLNSYRDLVKLADDEKDLISNLIAVKRRCSVFFPKDFWIGITEPTTIGAPAGYNLWVTLDEEVFGSYWYKIKTVRFYHNEVRLKLEVVRPVIKEVTPIKNIGVKEDLFHLDDVRNQAKLCLQDLINLLTISNVKEAIIFIFLLVTTLLTFCVQGIQYGLDYVLKLIRELSRLIKAFTPIIISFMKLVLNIVNGFYSLIVTLWRGDSTRRVDQTIYQISPYHLEQMYSNRQLPYRDRTWAFQRNKALTQPKSSVTITPLDD